MTTNTNDEVVDLFATDNIDAEPTSPDQPVQPKSTPSQRETLGALAGKSLEELAKMVQDSQAHIQRQANELGQLRKVVDGQILHSTVPPQPTATNGTGSADDDAEFFVNPRAAIAKALENNPVLRQLQETSQKNAVDQARAAVQKKHPDSANITASPEFQQWVVGSPARRALMEQALKHADAAAAIDILDLYKATALQKQAADPATDLASSGGSASPSEGSKGKKYSRAQIQRLMTEQPERYRKLAGEIRQAYLEGRVV